MLTMTGELSPRTHILLLTLLAALPVWHAITTKYDAARYIYVATLVMLNAAISWKYSGIGEPGRYRRARAVRAREVARTAMSFYTHY